MLDFLWMQVVKQSKKPNKQNLPESLQSDSPLAPAPCPFLCSKCQLVRFTVWKECAGLCEDRPVGGGGGSVVSTRPLMLSTLTQTNGEHLFKRVGYELALCHSLPVHGYKNQGKGLAS